MPRYKLTIAYDGTDFCGWQKQEPYQTFNSRWSSDPAPSGESLESFDPKAPTPPVAHPSDLPPSRKHDIQGLIQREGEDRPRVQLRTVQHIVERAVREIVHEPIDLLGASRTDSGVHARGQVAAFTCSGDETGEGQPAPHPHTGWPLSRGLDKLIRALNGQLPEDVIVLAADPVALNFDPVTGPTAKAYSYTLHVSRTRPLWDRRYVHQIWEALDLSRMQEAARRITGEHDFAAFAAAGHGRLNTVRTVFSCEVLDLPPVDGEPRFRIEVSGSGFLYNMVRIIAGTLVACGRGRMTADDVSRTIESKDRRNAGPTLPPTGLCLEWIRYG